MEAGEETSVVGGEEKPRPWNCCDEAICTMSFPPICFCRDRVKKCAKTCNKCDKDESDASRHVCGDSYFGWPGPRCTNPDDGHVPSGPGVSGPPVVGQEAAVSEEIAVDGEKPRPWKCCDQTLCTRSAPPTCFCHDKVKKCAKTCKNCLKDESGTSLRVCGDPYFGWPGPKCHKI